MMLNTPPGARLRALKLVGVAEAVGQLKLATGAVAVAAQRAEQVGVGPSAKIAASGDVNSIGELT